MLWFLLKYLILVISLFVASKYIFTSPEKSEDLNVRAYPFTYPKESISRIRNTSHTYMYTIVYPKESGPPPSKTQSPDTVKEADISSKYVHSNLPTVQPAMPNSESIHTTDASGAASESPVAETPAAGALASAAEIPAATDATANLQVDTPDSSPPQTPTVDLHAAKSPEKYTVDDAVEYFCAEKDVAMDVCGPTGSSSWQCIYARRHRAMLQGLIPPKVLIWECRPHETLRCGGAGDRFRGLTNVLYSAVASGRALLLHLTRPSLLSDAYTPRAIEWDFSALTKSHRPSTAFNFTLNEIPTNDRPLGTEVSESFKEFLFNNFDDGLVLDYLPILSWPRYYQHFPFWNETNVNPLIRIWTNAPINARPKFFAMRIEEDSENYKHTNPVTPDIADIHTALKKMTGTPMYMAGCMMDFLFTLSPKMKEYVTKSVLGIVSNQTWDQLDKINLNEVQRNLLPDLHKVPTEKDQSYPRVSLTEHISQTKPLHSILKSGRLITTEDKLVGVHLRMKGIFGKFDGRRRFQAEEIDSLMFCAKTFTQELGWEWDKTKIVFISDKSEVREKAAAVFPGKVFSPPLVNGTFHIDLSGQDPTGTRIIETMAEPTILSLCDAAVISPSGFSFVAMAQAFLPLSKLLHYGADETNKCLRYRRHVWGQVFG